MLRGLIAFLVLAAIASGAFWYWYQRRLAFEAEQRAQIDQLTKQVAQLQSENEANKAALNKVEQEENRLASENQLLLKELEQAKVTGKLPKNLPLPYPPK
jgi:uncharacterized protein YlxW (UPF0749 family)